MRFGLPSLLAVTVVACRGAEEPPLDPVFAVSPSGNPFVGSWQGTDALDGSHQRLTVGDGRRMPTRLLDDAASSCLEAGFGFVPASINGFASITNDDPHDGVRR